MNTRLPRFKIGQRVWLLTNPKNNWQVERSAVIAEIRYDAAADELWYVSDEQEAIGDDESLYPSEALARAAAERLNRR